MRITMTVLHRIYKSCQLDMLAGHYGLTPVKTSSGCGNTRSGWTFTGSVDAWRKLADDVDFRSSGGFSSDCATRKTDGLHGRINKHLAKVAA